jgi:hypothetical protein
MTYQHNRNPLPDPGIGRNPPKYRKIINTGTITALMAASFLGVGAFYYYMSGAPSESAARSER